MYSLLLAVIDQFSNLKCNISCVDYTKQLSSSPTYVVVCTHCGLFDDQVSWFLTSPDRTDIEILGGYIDILQESPC